MGLDDPRYARDIAYPFRFTENCDLALDENEQVIEQSIILILFIPRGSVILFRVFGSDVMHSVFDPMDDAGELALDTSIRYGIEEFEPRVFLDRDIELDELADSNKLLVIVPVTIRNTGQQYTARIPLPRPGMRSIS